MNKTTNKQKMPKRHMVARLLAVFTALFLTCGTIYAAGDAKRISLKCDNASMESVLRKIESLSGVKIIFTFDEVKPYQVTMDVKNVTAFDAVKTAIGNKPLSYRSMVGTS